MGWASGGQLADEVWRIVERHVPQGQRQEVARQIVKAFEDHDADDWDFDGVYYIAFPDELEAYDDIPPRHL